MDNGIQATAAPELNIPASSSLVLVHAIDTTALLSLNASNFVEPPLPGHEIYDVKAMAFLITNQKTGRKVMFDFASAFLAFDDAGTDRVISGIIEVFVMWKAVYIVKT